MLLIKNVQNQQIPIRIHCHEFGPKIYLYWVRMITKWMWNYISVLSCQKFNKRHEIVTGIFCTNKSKILHYLRHFHTSRRFALLFSHSVRQDIIPYFICCPLITLKLRPPLKWCMIFLYTQNGTPLSKSYQKPDSRNGNPRRDCTIILLTLKCV